MVKSDSEMLPVDAGILGAAEVLLQMHAEDISPRQIQVVDDIASQQAGLEQLKTRLADFDFPNKLYEVVDCPLLDHCIRWNAGGTSLEIVSRDAFCKDALNLLCQGSFGSLIRQFQSYGFKKNTKSQGKDEYSHKKGYFRRDQKLKLKKIRRKEAEGRALQLAEGTDHQWLCVEGRQTLLEEEMTRLKQEVAALREFVRSRAHAT